MSAFRQIVVFLICATVSGALTQNVGDGTTLCHNVTTMANLDYERLLNFTKWYEVMRTKTTAEENLCGSISFKVNSGVFLFKFNDEIGWAIGDYDSDDGPGWPFDDGRYSFTVVETDYYNFALIYSCKEPEVGEEGPSEFFWVLSATDNSNTQQIQDSLLQYPYLQSMLLSNPGCQEKTNNIEMVDNQKDEMGCYNVSTTSEFDITKFMNQTTWYEVWRTNNTVEDSKCGQIRFNWNEGADKFSYKFNDDKFGTGNPISGDKEYTWKFDGAEHNFVVVDTDNYNFAIIYSCKAPEPDEQLATEYFWVLSSRDNSSNQQINNSLANYPYLEEMLKNKPGCTDEDTNLISTTTAPPMCKYADGNDNINVTRFMEREWTILNKGMFGGDCGSLVYTPNADGFAATLPGNKTILGDLTAMTWILNDRPFSHIVVDVDPDYNNSAILYACSPLEDGNAIEEYAWLLTNCCGTQNNDTMSSHEDLKYLLPSNATCDPNETTTDSPSTENPPTPPEATDSTTPESTTTPPPPMPPAIHIAGSNATFFLLSEVEKIVANTS